MPPPPLPAATPPIEKHPIKSASVHRNLAVLGYFGEGNFGDDLLAAAMLVFLCRHFDPERIVVSSGTHYLEDWFPGIQCVPLGKILRDGPQHGRKVILAGGGLLYAFPGAHPKLWGLRDTSALWYWRRLGWRLWQQSHAYGFCLGAGPLDGSVPRWVTRRFLAPVERISVRDSASAALLSEMGLDGVSVVTDPACGLAEAPVTGAEIRRRSAGIVVRAWPFGPAPRAMLGNLMEAAQSLRRTGWEVEFLSFHPEQDRDAIQELERHGEQIRSWYPGMETIHEFRRHLARFGVIASMRAHGLLLGAMGGASTVSLCIEPKLRIFAERWAPDSILLEPPSSSMAITDGVLAAEARPPCRTDWGREIRLLSAEYATLLQWLRM